jgi:tetratricopeptide (TPR) repeat protein
MSKEETPLSIKVFMTKPSLITAKLSSSTRATPRPTYNRGLANKEKGEYDQAISDYNKALELKPNYADAYNNRGIAHDDKGEYDQAISDYDMALKINPTYTLAQENRELALKAKGEAKQKASVKSLIKP